MATMETYLRLAAAQRRLLRLTVGVAAVNILVVLATIFALLVAGERQSGRQLRLMADDRARLTGAIYERRAHDGMPPEENLRLLLTDFTAADAGRELGPIEFVVARRTVPGIEVLYASDQPPGQPPVVVPPTNQLAEPIRQALEGRPGLVRGLDYAGVPVLAGSQVVPGLDLVVVVKMDLADVRGPYLRAGLVALLAALLVALITGAVSASAGRLAHAALRDQQWLGLIFEGLPVLVWTCDREARVQALNRSPLLPTDLTPASLRAGEAVGPASPGQAPLDFETARLATLTGEPTTCRVRVGERVYDCFLAPRRANGQTGEPIGVVGLALEVTAEVEGEATRERLRQQLDTARKMEAVGRLAGGLAHDFNNLLTPILGCCSFLEEVIDETHPNREDVETIQLAADRAALLARQLLTLSRHEVVRPQLLDPGEVAAAMQPMLARLLPENIDLRWRLADGLPPVEMNLSHLEQVLLNLCVNARDAMPHGGTLTLETGAARLDATLDTTHGDLPDGDYVLLAVSDTGVGMDEETRRHVFEPFFTTKAGGTGFGLATVYAIVKQAGGGVYIYSEPQRGTTVKVYLPRATTDTSAAALELPEPTRLTGAESILVLEDDAMLRGTVVKALESAGYTVREAASVAEAVALASALTEPLDLLLTDVVLPDDCGTAAAAALGATRPGLRVLYMSGYATNSVVEHGLLRPEVNFLAKPFGRDELLRAVRQSLDRPSDEEPPDLRHDEADEHREG